MIFYIKLAGKLCLPMAALIFCMPGMCATLNRHGPVGDYLILGLNTDQSVQQIKGPQRPLNNELDRAEVVGALKSVDAVVLFGEQTAEVLIAKVLKPDVYVKGGDYTLDTLPEAKIVQAYGGRVEFINMVEGRSTTNIIEKIKNSIE